MDWKLDSDVLSFAKGFSAPHELLFLVHAGSKLHGTTTPDSDVDVKGIYLPQKEFMFLRQEPTYLKYNTNTKGKNSNDDFDLEMWSFQEWTELLKKGDTNAVSILYGCFTEHAVIYVSERGRSLLAFANKMYDNTNIAAYTGFAQQHAVRYGIKGSRYKAIQDLITVISSKYDPNITTRIKDLDVEEIIELLSDDSLKYVKFDDEYIHVMEKQHLLSVTLNQLLKRLKKEMYKYGHRTISSTDSKYEAKALSHAIRCLMEAKEMLTKGFVSYPLEESELLTSIKKGGISEKEVEKMYSEMYDEVDLLNKLPKKVTSYDETFFRDATLELYK